MIKNVITLSSAWVDFVVNFSYRLGIGEDYDTWQAEEANWRKGSEVKVCLAVCRIYLLKILSGSANAEDVEKWKRKRSNKTINGLCVEENAKGRHLCPGHC